MKVETIELLLVCSIVLIQLWIFFQSLAKINRFRNTVPPIESLRIEKLLVPADHLNKMSPKEILEQVEDYKNSPASSDLDFHGTKRRSSRGQVEVNIVECNDKVNQTFSSILFSINNYLIRNRGASSDFAIVKDIVERITKAQEEEINTQVSVPLYLGLAGTMIGIVIGLFNMPDLGADVATGAKDALLNDGIGLLIGGVKIAMIASFSGLILTLLNSAGAFRGSRHRVETRKNDMYTFLQIELLPIVNQGIASTFESLQRNLGNFNAQFMEQLMHFSNTVNSLSGVFDSSKEAIVAQKELLEAVDRTKVSELTRYNLQVLQQLEVSFGHFDKFNLNFVNINAFVSLSEELVSRTNELLARTSNFKTIADNLDSRLTQSQMLLEFLSLHFKKLEDHKQLTSNAVADVGHAISSTFSELKAHIVDSSEAVKRFTVDELEALRVALASSKTGLNELSHLATIEQEVVGVKGILSEQNKRINQQLEALNRSMARTITLLERQSLNTNSEGGSGFGTSLKRLFSRKSKAE
jgi:hypothetical protein